MVVVIPTRERNALLTRTLDSLVVAQERDPVDEVVVAFNGSERKEDSLERDFGRRLPLKVYHFPEPGKSRALNRVFSDYPDQIAVLFDDDVIVEEQTLRAFRIGWEAVDGARAFLCGAVEPDYEKPPPSWLRAYLPASVNGWKPWKEATWFDEPDALGANLSFRVQEVLDAGGFSESRGPGTRSRGQESEMQQRLMRSGFRGRYLPDAVVWHYVPAARCDPDWALDRAYQMGVGFGLESAGKLDGFSSRRRAFWRACKREALRAIVASCGPWVGERRRFHWMYRMMDYAGYTAGYRQGLREVT